MKKNQIRVLFFSKTSHLLGCIEALFSSELDLKFEYFVCLNDLYSFEHDKFNTVVVLDLSDSISDFLEVLHEKEVKLRSLVTIFLVENEKKLNFIREKNFNSADVMLKPFSVNDLLNKIRSFTGHIKQMEEFPILLSGYYFNPKTCEIKNVKGQSVRLTEKETDIITFFYKERGKVLSKAVLLKQIWGYSEKISTHTLETHIYRLRKKIQVGLGDKKLILKKKGGYYLNP